MSEGKMHTMTYALIVGVFVAISQHFVFSLPCEDTFTAHLQSHGNGGIMQPGDYNSKFDCENRCRNSGDCSICSEYDFNNEDKTCWFYNSAEQVPNLITIEHIDHYVRDACRDSSKVESCDEFNLLELCGEYSSGCQQTFPCVTCICHIDYIGRPCEVVSPDIKDIIDEARTELVALRTQIAKIAVNNGGVPDKANVNLAKTVTNPVTKTVAKAKAIKVAKVGKSKIVKKAPGKVAQKKAINTVPIKAAKSTKPVKKSTNEKPTTKKNTKKNSKISKAKNEKQSKAKQHEKKKDVKKAANKVKKAKHKDTKAKPKVKKAKPKAKKPKAKAIKAKPKVTKAKPKVKKAKAKAGKHKAKGKGNIKHGKKKN